MDRRLTIWSLSMTGNNGRTFERWLIPAVIIAFCTAAYWITAGFDRMPPILKRGIQPSDFPQLTAGFIVILTLLMAVFDPVRAAGRVSGRTWISLALIFVFAALTFIDLFLALAVFAAALARLWNEKRASVLALVGIAAPVTVFLLFDLAFRIRFPRGLLTDLWYG